MLCKQDIIADMHTHTNFSLHAYSTVKENIVCARKNGIQYLAITDHYYGNIDDLARKNEVNRIRYLRERVNKLEADIEVLGSAEFNLDQFVFQFEKLKDIPWRPVGLHNWFLDTDSLDLEELRDFFFIDSEKYNVFNHIEREIHKVSHGKYGDKVTKEVKSFFDALVNFAKIKNIYLEVNESTLANDECGSVERLRYWLSVAKENRNKICLGSDAHYCEEVGVFNKTLSLLNDLNYPKELILNCNKEELDLLFVDY